MIERIDLGDNAERLPARKVQMPIALRERLALDLGNQARAVAQPIRVQVMSPRMPTIALPESTASISASSSAFSSMRSASRSRQRARCLIGRRDQSLKAALAAFTARSTSVSLADGTSASFSMLDGLIETNDLSSAGATHRPPINRPRGLKLSFGDCIAVLSIMERSRREAPCAPPLS